MTALQISALTCGYQAKTRQNGTQQKEHPILSELNLTIKDGEIVCLLGRSGCGKTTLLKAISGLVQLQGGSIQLHGREVSSVTTMTPPEQRSVGMIFQDYALFPHLTVHENIAFGLRDLSTQEQKNRVQEMLTLVNLHGLDKRYPHELSGGQQQRVAIARALANKPSLLLLDEPFSNIDSQVRHHLVREIREILKQQKVAALFVTHSREEGFAFADTIALMGQGHVIQRGSAFELYHRPLNRFVAQFMGAGSFLPAKIKGRREVSTPLGTVLSTQILTGKTGDQVEIFIRPQMLDIQESGASAYNKQPSTPQSSTPQTPHLQAKVLHQQFMGQTMRSELQLDIDQTHYHLVSEHSHFIQKEAIVTPQVKAHELILFNDDEKVV